MDRAIVLFGEAEKGMFQAAYYCQTLSQLSDFLGEPPHEEAKGLTYAVHTLLNSYEVVFFRVREEGFSTKDYLSGLETLQKKELFPEISAICLPGVGDREIIEATDSVCALHNSLLIISQQDLYDYLTA